MDLQVTHLRTLQAIVRHGSFSRAAQALNLTQPAVSMQVRHLERALGLPLLERVGKRAFPTRAGEVLLAIAPTDFRGAPRLRRGAAERRGSVGGRVGAPHEIDAPTLAGHPLILFEAGATLRRIIDGWFHRAGVAPRSPMEMGNTEAIKKLVEAGLGLSITSWFSVKGEVRDCTLAALRLTPPLERLIGLVRRRDKPRTPALDAFV